jgi:hypothetical protein
VKDRHLGTSFSRLLLVLVVVALIVGHLLVPYALAHLGVSFTLVSGLGVLVILKHLGLVSALLGSLRGRLRRRTPH